MTLRRYETVCLIRSNDPAVTSAFQPITPDRRGKEESSEPPAKRGARAPALRLPELSVKPERHRPVVSLPLHADQNLGEVTVAKTGKVAIGYSPVLIT